MNCVICAENYGELIITNLSVRKGQRFTFIYAHQDCMDEWNKNNPDIPVNEVPLNRLDDLKENNDAE